MTKTEALVANVIKQQHTTHYKAIAKKLKKSDGSIRKILSVMSKAGYVTMLGEGHYQLVDSNIQVMESKPGPEPRLDIAKSNDLALRNLVKTREIVSRLLDDFNNGRGVFPKDEINAVKALESSYKEDLKEKTEIVENEEKPKNFFILPHNSREKLTDEQYEDQQNYTNMGLKKSPLPKGNIIIKDDKQLDFPF